jgi:hypothetical protein
MNILLLSRYGTLGASSRVRFYQYLPYLQANGMNVQVASFFDDDYVRDLYAGKKPSIMGVARAYLSRLSNILRSSRYDLLCRPGSNACWHALMWWTTTMLSFTAMTSIPAASSAPRWATASTRSCAARAW